MVWRGRPSSMASRTASSSAICAAAASVSATAGAMPSASNGWGASYVAGQDSAFVTSSSFTM